MAEEPNLLSVSRLAILLYRTPRGHAVCVAVLYYAESGRRRRVCGTPCWAVEESMQVGFERSAQAQRGFSSLDSSCMPTPNAEEIYRYPTFEMDSDGWTPFARPRLDPVSIVGAAADGRGWVDGRGWMVEGGW